MRKRRRWDYLNDFVGVFCPRFSSWYFSLIFSAGDLLYFLRGNSINRANLVTSNSVQVSSQGADIDSQLEQELVKW